jgi:uncharacterized membrane protein
LGKDALFALVILALTIILIVVPMPSRFRSAFGDDTVRARARVVEVDDSNLNLFGIVRTGEQVVTARVLDGELKGQEVQATNILLGQMQTDKMFRAGDTAFLVLDFKAGELFAATAYDHYRLPIILILVVLFGLLLVVFAGWSGARALLSFVFALLLMWKVLFPQILLGRDPVWFSLVVVTIITAATLYLVAGVNRVALVAFLGSVLGILLTMSLATILLPPFRIHGAIQPFSETLLYSGFDYLNLTRVFVAAVFVGASGAVLDVAIDVSTAMGEVIQKRPDLSRAELIKSGFVVGRNMTSTMVTTLLMAYASGYMVLLMYFIGRGIPPLYLVNTVFVAAEILRTVVGSFGLVTVAPFTALVGGLIYVRQRSVHERAQDIGEPQAVQD